MPHGHLRSMRFASILSHQNLPDQEIYEIQSSTGSFSEYRRKYSVWWLPSSGQCLLANGMA